MGRPKGFDELPVLDKAMQTFWSGTYAGTSTQDLCASTGLSRSSLYNTFHSKADLYRRALERYAQARDEERQRYLRARGTGRQVLRRLLTDVVTDQAAADDRRSCLVINAAVELGERDERVARLARRNMEDFRALLQQVIARGQDDGSISSDWPARDLAALVHATLNGLQVAGRVFTDKRESARVIRSLMSLI